MYFHNQDGTALDNARKKNHSNIVAILEAAMNGESTNISNSNPDANTQDTDHVVDDNDDDGDDDGDDDDDDDDDDDEILSSHIIKWQ